MAISHNPTKTKSIENAWMRDIRRRWASFAKASIRELKAADQRAFLANRAISLDLDQAREYLKLFDQQADTMLIGSESAPNWQARYQVESYVRGLQVGTREVQQQLDEPVDSGADRAIAALSGSLSGMGALQFAVSLLAPKHQASIEFLFDRSYSKLSEWVDKLKTETAQIIKDAIDQGTDINEVAKQIRARIDVSKSRAETIARTEINSATNEATATEAARLEEILGEPVLIRWVSALSSTTRHLHGEWHGTLIDQKENRRRKSAPHIYNCKCSSQVAIASKQTPAIQARFDKQREEFRKRETKLNL